MNPFHVNKAAIQHLGFFLTSGKDDVCPKEHFVLKAAVDKAHEVLKENKIRARNIQENYHALDDTVVAQVKEAIQLAAADNTVALGPNDNKDLLDSFNGNSAAFAHAYSITFACMIHYKQLMEEQSARFNDHQGHRGPHQGGAQGGHYQGGPRGYQGGHHGGGGYQNHQGYQGNQGYRGPRKNRDERQEE
jgi:hypothetical protein